MNRVDLSDMSKVTPDTLDRLAKELGKDLAGVYLDRGGKERQSNDVKTHQIRNLYSAVQRIRARAERQSEDIAEINRQLIFFKPLLAYASARQNKQQQQEKMKVLRERLLEAIDGVVKKTDQKEHEKARANFFFLMEAIVAYHKFYGGRDS